MASVLLSRVLLSGHCRCCPGESALLVVRFVQCNATCLDRPCLVVLADGPSGLLLAGRCCLCCMHLFASSCSSMAVHEVVVQAVPRAVCLHAELMCGLSWHSSVQGGPKLFNPCHERPVHWQTSNRGLLAFSKSVRAFTPCG
jgi:hypothetical protein